MIDWIKPEGQNTQVSVKPIMLIREMPRVPPDEKIVKLNPTKTYNFGIGSIKLFQPWLETLIKRLDFEQHKYGALQRMIYASYKKGEVSYEIYQNSLKIWP